VQLHASLPDAGAAAQADAALARAFAVLEALDEAAAGGGGGGAGAAAAPGPAPAPAPAPAADLARTVAGLEAELARWKSVAAKLAAAARAAEG